MNSLTNSEIKELKILIENSKESLSIVLNSYKQNVEDINTNINAISFSDWEDDIATSFNEYNSSLKNGIVTSLNNSIGEAGSLRKLKELIEDLELACGDYEKYMTDCMAVDPYIGYSTDGVGLSRSQQIIHSTDWTPPENEQELDVSNCNRELDTIRESISDILSQIKNLKFDSEVSFDGRYVSREGDVNTVVSAKPVVINQFDKVKVLVQEDEESDASVKEMYYLGTDSKGRSYFSESLDDSAIAYVAIWPGILKSGDADINHWMDEYGDNPTISSAMAESMALFVLTGGNTGTLTKGNVLQKMLGSYANAQYVGDANFNNSIVFENPSYAPEIVERGDSSYDAANAYHVIDVDNNPTVSLSSVLQSDNAISDVYHPDILLKPGEKIEVKYGWIFGTSCTIGSDSESVLLHYDEDQKQYYVVSETGGYYTAARNEASDYGFRMISIDKLNSKKTKYILNE